MQVLFKTLKSLPRTSRLVTPSFTSIILPPTYHFSSLQVDPSERRKIAFSHTKDLKPRDVESRLMTCKSINDYHECFTTLNAFADAREKHKLNKDRILQFLVSINQTLKFQSVSLNFVRHTARFLAKYDLISTFDTTLLAKTALMKKRSFVEHQDDIMEILDHLATNIKENEEIRTLLSEIESAFTERLDELKEKNLIKLYYHYLNYQHQGNKKFAKALENEVILRSDNLEQAQLVDSLKLFSLAPNSEYFRSKIPSILETNIVSYLGQLSEIELLKVVGYLRNYQDLSKSFCVEFQKAIASKCSNLNNKTLLAVLNFVTLDQFKLSSDIIYQIETEIISRRFKNVNKFLLKDLTESEHYASKNSLVNNLFKYALSYMGSNNAPASALEVAETVPAEDENDDVDVEKLFEDNRDALRAQVIKGIADIRNPFELKLVVNVSTILKIESADILHAEFQQLLALKKSNELSLTYLSNVIYNLLELRYYIDFKKNDELYKLFNESIKLRIHEASPQTCSDLMKILCRYVVYDPKLEGIEELVNITANKIISEKYFYVVQERTDLLSHLTASPISCHKALIEYLLSYFDPEANKFYKKEVYYLNYRLLYGALYKIKAFLPDINLDTPLLHTIWEKGEHKFKEQAEWLKNKRGDTGVLKDISRNLQKISRQIPGLTYQISPIVDCYSMDLEIRLKEEGSEKTVYFDICAPTQFQVNSKDLLVMEKLTKKQYLAHKGYDYRVIVTQDWKKAELKEVYLKNKILEWFPESAYANKF